MEIVTSSGPVRGRRTSTGTVFLGVPYAAPPVGAGRFAAPAPHEPWTEVRDATEPGPTAPQPVRDFGGLDLSPYFSPGWRRGPDYLTVNLWVPPPRPGPVPVMVFVPGGGFTAGSGYAPLYDGSAFARDGVLLVTLNYRLGLPGFLHLSDAPDNRGLLDVLAALRWLGENVARFGGDPARITLFGQSAGAVIVAGVLADPAAKGLFRRAISQSGTGTGAATRSQARVVTAALGNPTAAALAPISDERLVALLPPLSRLQLDSPLGEVTPLSLVLDEQPADTLTDGVELLIGSNTDEAALYRGSPEMGDRLFRTGTRRLTEANARLAPTYAYEFSWRSSTLGASHVMELPFVFDCLDLPALHGPNALLGTGAPPAELATRMHAAWIRFAATGDPGWPRYDALSCASSHVFTSSPQR